MNFTEFLISSLEGVVANIPGLVVILYGIINMGKMVKRETMQFPAAVTNTKDSLKKEFDAHKLAAMQSFEQAQKDIRAIVASAGKEIHANVTGVMTAMQKELSQFREMITAIRDQSALLLEENKIFAEIIMNLISKDPKLVREGVTSFCTGKLQDLLVQADKNLNDFLSHLPSYEEVIRELLSTIGQTEFDKLLERIGHEGKEKELPVAEQAV